MQGFLQVDKDIEDQGVWSNVDIQVNTSEFQ